MGLAGRKRWMNTTSAPFCSVPSSEELPASSTVDSAPLSMLPIPSCPSGETQLQVVNTTKPDWMVQLRMQPSPRSCAVQEQLAWAGHCASGAEWSSSTVQLGGFFSTVVFCSLELRGGECQAAARAAIFPFVSGDHMVLSTILSLSQAATWNWTRVMSTFVCVNHPLFCKLVLIVAVTVPIFIPLVFVFSRLLSQPVGLHLCLSHQRGGREKGSGLFEL